LGKERVGGRGRGGAGGGERGKRGGGEAAEEEKEKEKREKLHASVKERDTGGRGSCTKEKCVSVEPV